MNVTVLVDSEKSWFVPYAKELVESLIKKGIEAELIHEQSKAMGGEICFLLSCTKVVKDDFLQKYQKNIVVHGSDLPSGKGFAPLKWQILEGKNEIVLTMFEAVKEVDAGDWYRKEKLSFTGTELLDELQKKMAEKIISMCVEYVLCPEQYPGRKQTGEESFYKRPSEADDELDIDKTIRQQMNHFRIADNERFPVWFQYQGRKYILKIYPGDEEEK